MLKLKRVYTITDVRRTHFGECSLKCTEAARGFMQNEQNRMFLLILNIRREITKMKESTHNILTIVHQKFLVSSS